MDDAPPDPATTLAHRLLPSHGRGGPGNLITQTTARKGGLADNPRGRIGLP